MGWLEAVVLGLVQGLTEFLPISSSAHLRITASIAGWDDPGAAFTAVTQLGTESAVLLYFRRDIWAIVATWTQSLWRPELRGEPPARMGWYVIVGTLPIGILGLALKDPIETQFRDLRLVGATLVLFAFVLWYADRTARIERPLERLTIRDAVLLGFAQAMALVPGVSRSGGTISGALLLGYTRPAAARYSFLLAIPAVLVSGVFQLRRIGDDPLGAPWGPTLLATAIAFVVGYAVIALFLRYIAKHTFGPFVAYRIVVGLLILGLVLSGVVEAESTVGS